ncbi:MAG: hypothetical protein KAI53_00050 [Candidatus Aenigmarchaeota archaeon]|nr:hypothetical protein [Candidatus Aenigmarchaeota archaeon]
MSSAPMDSLFFIYNTFCNNETGMHLGNQFIQFFDTLLGHDIILWTVI